MRFFITIILIALLVFFGVLIFGHRPAKQIITAKNLPTYADTGAYVRLTTGGIINGDDVHRQIRITVDVNQRTLDIIQGYNGNVISTKSYGNNLNAYQTFLKALQLNGFTKTRRAVITDEQGYCALGQRYTYELQNTGDKKTDMKLWNSTCGGGTFGGQGAVVRAIFENQITDFDELTNGVNLN